MKGWSSTESVSNGKDQYSTSMGGDNNRLQMLWSPRVIVINLAPHASRQNNRIQKASEGKIHHIDWEQQAEDGFSGLMSDSIMMQWKTIDGALSFDWALLCLEHNLPSQPLAFSVSLRCSMGSPMSCSTLEWAQTWLLRPHLHFVLYANMLTLHCSLNLNYSNLSENIMSIPFKNEALPLVPVNFISTFLWKLTSVPQSGGQASAQRPSCLLACLHAPISQCHLMLIHH